jgi:hypothetical protein
MPPTIAELLDRSRRELLDLSMRNRLLSIASKPQNSMQECPARALVGEEAGRLCGNRGRACL